MNTTLHSIRAAVAALLLGCAASASWAQAALTLPSTGTSAVATFESIGVYWKPGTNPGSAGCQVQYRKSTDTAWLNALPMWYDASNGECRGSIVQLASGTSYDIQLGLPGQAPSRQLRISTWAETFPVAQTVTLPPGTSNQTLNITQGGTPTGYVLYTTDPATQSTIDVANAQPYDVVISAPYVIVRGLVLKGAQADGIRLGDSAHDVVIENNDISGWGRSSGATSSLGYTIGVDEDAGVHAVCTTQNMTRIVVQRNKIHDPRYGANSWSDGHPAGPEGLAFDTCGGNHVIRYNEVYSTPGSTTGHYFNDGIGGAENFSTTGFPNADSDIYGNRVENTWDDCIEAEGGDRNVRVWGNYCNNTTTGVASTLDSVGPLYIFRNVYNRSRQLEAVPLDSDDRNVFAKSGSNSSFNAGRRYIFHNTLLQASQSGAVYGLGAGDGISGTGSTQLIMNTVSRNNIFQVWKTSYPAIAQAGSGNDFNYDLYNGPAGVTETNGITGTPIYAANNGWTSESGGLYQQATNSPGYDKGVRIPNFNDNYTGSAPDIGAAEAGAPPMVFGVKGGNLAASTGGTTTGTTGTTTGSTTGTTSGTSAGGATGTTSYAGTPYTGTPIALPGSFEAENFDRGGQNVGYYDTTPGNLGGQYRTSEDVDIIGSCDTAGGGYVINNIATGEWLNYTVNATAAGSYVFQLRASNNYSNATPAFHLEVDGVKATPSVAVPSTGGWCSFNPVAAPAINLSAGRHVVRIVADQQYFNLNSVSVTASATPTTTGSFMSSYKGVPYTGTPIAVPGSFEAENFDLGGQGVAYSDTTATNLGGQYRPNEAVDIVASTDPAGGGYVVNNFATGEWLNYTINVATGGNYVVQLRASNNYGSAAPAFHVEVDGIKVAGPVPVPLTGSWDAFQWVATPAFPLSAGPHVLRIVSDQQYFNLNSIAVTAPGATPGAVAGGGTTTGVTTVGGSTTSTTGGTATTTASATAIPSAAAWSCDFESTWCDFLEQSALGDAPPDARRSTLVSPGRSGNLAVRLHTEPGDNNVHGSGTWERDDLSITNSYSAEGQEEWWADSIMFPSDFHAPLWGEETYVVLDFHPTSSSGQPNVSVNVVGPYQNQALWLNVYGGGAPNNAPVTALFIPDPYGSTLGITRNVWYDFVFHMKWSATAGTALTEIYLNGKKVLSTTQGNLYSGYGAYLKLANYHGPYGVATSVIHDRTVQGSSAAAVAIAPFTP